MAVALATLAKARLTPAEWKEGRNLGTVRLSLCPQGQCPSLVLIASPMPLALVFSWVPPDSRTHFPKSQLQWHHLLLAFHDSSFSMNSTHQDSSLTSMMGHIPSVYTSTHPSHIPGSVLGSTQPLPTLLLPPHLYQSPFHLLVQTQLQCHLALEASSDAPNPK